DLMGLLLKNESHWHADETHWRVFLHKTREAGFHASWMVALMLLPFLSAMTQIKKLDWPFLVLAFVAFVPFASTATALGVAMSAVFAAVFPKRRMKEFLSVLGITIFVFVYAGVRLTLPRKLMEPDKLEATLEYVLYLQSPVASFLPSRWYVGVLNAYMAHDWPRLALSASILLGAAALGTLLLFLMSRFVLTPRRWSLVMEGGGSDLRVRAPQSARDDTSAASTSLWKMLIQKEVRFFFRDSQRFSNASFILAVCAIYLVSIFRLPMDTPQIRNFLSFINLAIGLFVIAALSLRFCFPQPSLELPYSWIIRVSPMRTSQFLGAKLVFNLVFLNVLSAILVVISP
ncbi:MAG: hypothetical protein AABZ44_07435, partial [Elusimicrobiota bacterium]